jgi:hypothetical protein
LGKISIYHYIEKNLQPFELITNNGAKNLYPLYINVTTRRKVFKFKSLFYKLLDTVYDKELLANSHQHYIDKNFLDENSSKHLLIKSILERENNIIHKLIRLGDNIPNEQFSLKRFNEIFEQGTIDAYQYLTRPLISSKELEFSILNVLEKLNLLGLFDIIDQSKPYRLISERLFFLLQNFSNHKNVVELYNTLISEADPYVLAIEEYYKKFPFKPTIIECTSSSLQNISEKRLDNTVCKYFHKMMNEHINSIQKLFIE